MSIFKDINLDMDIKEMEAILKYNSTQANSIKSKIEKIDKATKSEGSFSPDYSALINKDLFLTEIDDEDEDEEEEFKYYYDNIKEALNDCNTKEEMEKAIYDNLPVINNKNYCNIIRRIILELVNERNEYEALKDGEDERVIADLEKEQKLFDYLISLVRNHRNYEKTTYGSVDNVDNNIVFLTTTSGNIYAEGDLASIDPEYYAGFKLLLESIKDGSFRNIKRFSHAHNSLKGILEVKDFKIRVVFDRLKANTFIILDIFTKKSDCDMGYIEQVIRRVDYYKRIKDDLKDRVDDDMIKEHGVILANIFDGLDSKCIVKTKKSGE